MGFPSVCCEYHWLIKELLWAYSRAIGEQSLVGKTKQNAGRKEEELERSHGALPETDVGTLASKPQPHGDTQINRNGLN